MVFFLILDPTDMIIAGKLLIVVVWCGAAFSKIGKHFESVIPPMVSNTPWTPRAMKLSNYRAYPNDLKPSRLAWFMAHVMGTILEFVIPVILLLSTNWTVTIVSIVIIVAFHIFITSTFPLAVPWSGTSSSASSRWRSSPGTPMRTVSGSSTSASRGCCRCSWSPS